MRLLLCLPLLLAACVTPEPKYGREPGLLYEAFGEPPFWLLTIRDRELVLTIHDPALGPHTTSYAAVTARTEGKTTRWTAGGDGLGGIAVEARREPCTIPDGRRYEDKVTVSLSGRQLEGCGGEQIMSRPG